jgi:ATP-binding cassette, subfamily B, bacterial
MRFILPYLKQYKSLLFLALLLAAINQVFSLLDPQVFRMIIDNYVSKFETFSRVEFVKGVGLLLLLSMGVAMISRIAKNFQDYVVNTMTQKIGMQIYQNTINHVFSLPYAAFEDQQSGQLLQNLQKARDSVQAFISAMIDNVFTALVGVTFVLILALRAHWMVALFFGLMLPLMGVIVFFMSKKLKKAQGAIVAETAALAWSTTETIRNVSLIKSLGLESQEMDRIGRVNTGILWLELKKIKTVRLIDFSQGTMINFVRMCLLGTMFWLVFTKAISLGQFFSFYFYSFYIFSPLYMLGQVMQKYQEAKASDEVIQKILAMRPDESHDEHAVSPEAVTSLGFDHVSFSYTDGAPTISDISIHAQLWQTIAFVGPSGSGKSTIVKLLLGLYRPVSGTITLNDKPLTTINEARYKSQIGYVAQDTQLFSGTIRDNIRFVMPTATDDDVERSLRAAQLRDFVIEQTDGLDTRIGEGGLKLSGGQKQRLAIARALVRSPHILIFDEATSSLDSMVEAEITETIKEISQQQKSMITILIAHRLSTIMHADTIYVVEAGKLVEEGKHEDLVEGKGLYYALWRQQTGV